MFSLIEDIKKKSTQYTIWNCELFPDVLASRVSPYFSVFFVKRKVKPNKITILMILSGLLGALLFSLPYISCKIVGFVFFHIWYILDVSDGEVARYTKCFSLYGREIDYMAHIINHPFFNFAIFLSYLQLDKYNTIYLSILFLTLIGVEMLYRNLTSLTIIEQYKEEIATGEGNNVKSSKIKHLFIAFILYPNFVLYFTLFYFLDYAGIMNSLIMLSVYVFVLLLFVFRVYYRKLNHYYAR